MHLSVVTTLFHSGRFVREFHCRITQAIAQMGIVDYEVIYVCDGYTDGSDAIVRGIADAEPEVHCIQLSRNFGHHYALLAGMRLARGEWVMIIDVDLETEPEVIGEYYEKGIEERADVVYGYQSSRKGAWVERVSGALFWRLFNALSEVKVPINPMTERVMSRRYVDALLELGDRNVFLAGMMHWVGFKQIGIPTRRNARKGRSSYSFTKRFSLMVNAMSSFSAYPLKLLFWIGMGIMALSFAATTWIASMKIISPDRILSGYTSLAIIMLFSLGMIVISIGTIGIYLEKIYNQVRNRPLYVVSEYYKGKERNERGS